MEIDIILKIAIIGILTAIVNTLLKKVDKEELATLTTLAALVIVLLIVVDMINQLFSVIKNMFLLY